MARFKAKAQFVEAQQFFKDAPTPDGVAHDRLGRPGVVDWAWFWHEVEEGDWVIAQGNGHYTKLDNDTFLETYEAVQE